MLKYLRKKLEKLKDFIFRPISNVVSGLRQGIVWFRFGYSDRDYDHAFLVKATKFKLERMHKFFEERSYSKDPTEVLEEIQEVIDVAERWLKGEYFEEEYDALDERWGALRWVTEPAGNGFVRLVETYHKKAKEQDRNEEARKQFRDHFDACDRAASEDFKKIWTLIAKNAEKWWD